MALLDSLTKSGTIRIPENSTRPSANPSEGGNTKPTASQGVAKIPTPVNTPYASNTDGSVVILPNADTYDPLSTKGMYSPNALDVLGKFIGVADARQFLKTYDFTRDPSKALFLANLAQEIIWGVLPKNRVPTHKIQREGGGGSNKSFLGKLASAAVKKATEMAEKAADSLSAGLYSNLKAVKGVKTPVQKQFLTNQILYGTGNASPLGKPDAWTGTYSGYGGTGDVPEISVPLNITPLQTLAGTLGKAYAGDTKSSQYHLANDVFANGIKDPVTISNGGPAKTNGKYNDTAEDDYGLKADFNTSNENIKYYTELVTAYGIKSEDIKSPSDAVKWAIETLGCSVGYRSWYGFEPGSNHVWDIQIYPYNGYDAEPSSDPNSPLPEEPDPFNTVTPKLPSYTLPDLSGEGQGHVLSFGKNCPVLNYTLQIGSQKSKELHLYNGDLIHMPMGFSYDMIMSLNVLDDIHGSFYNWMSLYMNKLYDISGGKVVRYDQGAVIIRLIVFKGGYSPKYEFRFIAVPYNYSPQIEGEYAPNETQVHVDFHIIGMKSGITGTVIDPLSEPSHQEDVMAKTDWTDVILTPHKPEDSIE